MNDMFKKVIEDGASDIHIKAGDYVRARLHGDLVPLTDQKISHAQVQELAMKLIPHEKDRAAIEVGKAAANSPSDLDLKMNILGGPGSGHAGGVPGGGDPNSMFG